MCIRDRIKIPQIRLKNMMFKFNAHVRCYFQCVLLNDNAPITEFLHTLLNTHPQKIYIKILKNKN